MEAPRLHATDRYDGAPMPLDPTDLDPDPLRQLDAWLADAERAEPMPNAFALATADADVQPSVRFVLLRGIDGDGLRFFTNRGSRKGRDLAINPWASAAFWWPSQDRQARVAGPVRLLPEEASIAYWRSRPRGSQLSASASQQGREIASRTELEAAVAEIASRHPIEVPLPPFWGGYLLTPHVVEFWESRADRLHDRVEYRRGGDGSWHRRRLQP
jgi:pyridoxamine 5'-phosphate oxidase